jgi:hypothetical protein
MYIQYVGFDGTASSRVYNFHVIDTPHESREFAVEVQSEAFQPSQLGFQDGPAISFECLKRGLEEETQEASAERHLNIGEPDVRAYLETHRRVKASGARRRERTVVKQNGYTGGSDPVGFRAGTREK